MVLKDGFNWRIWAPVICFLLLIGSVGAWYKLQPASIQDGWAWDWHQGIAIAALCSLLPVQREAYYYSICNLIWVCVALGSLPLIFGTYQAPVTESWEPIVGYWVPLTTVLCLSMAFYFWPGSEPGNEDAKGSMLRRPRQPFTSAGIRRWANRAYLFTCAVCAVILLVGHFGWALITLPPAALLFLLSCLPGAWWFYYLAFRIMTLLVLWGGIDQLMGGIIDSHGVVAILLGPVLILLGIGGGLMFLLSIKPKRYRWVEPVDA